MGFLQLIKNFSEFNKYYSLIMLEIITQVCLTTQVIALLLRHIFTVQIKILTNLDQLIDNARIKMVPKERNISPQLLFINSHTETLLSNIALQLICKFEINRHIFILVYDDVIY